jgi:hypothetical protein
VPTAQNVQWLLHDVGDVHDHLLRAGRGRQARLERAHELLERRAIDRRQRRTAAALEVRSPVVDDRQRSPGGQRGARQRRRVLHRRPRAVLVVQVEREGRASR